MGVVYYLAREDNRTLFELGKWHALSDVFEELCTHRPWAGFVLPDEDTLRTLLRASIADERLDVDSDAYAAEIARRIVNFGRDRAKDRQLRSRIGDSPGERLFKR